MRRVTTLYVCCQDRALPVHRRFFGKKLAGEGSILFSFLGGPGFLCYHLSLSLWKRFRDRQESGGFSRENDETSHVRDLQSHSHPFSFLGKESDYLENLTILYL
jgi:hypothetical protein